MILTLQEIDNKIQEQEELKKRIEEKISSLLETIEFKRMQNGTDSVEVQNITDTINTLRLMRRDCIDEINSLEELKKSCCEKRRERSKLVSDFYGY